MICMWTQGLPRVALGAITEVAAATATHRRSMNEAPNPSYRQLRRSRDDRMVAGVCSGIAHYFHLDPTLVRVGFAVLVIISWGVALVGYLLGWLLIPE